MSMVPHIREWPLLTAASDVFNWPAVKRFDRSDVSCRCDVFEKDDEIMIDAELPGIEKDQIHVELDKNHVLKITGESSDRWENSDDLTYHVSERTYGRVSRSFTLPDYCDLSKIRAEHNHALRIGLSARPHGYRYRTSNYSRCKIHLQLKDGFSVFCEMILVQCLRSFSSGKLKDKIVGKSHSSTQWLRRHMTDPFVVQARLSNYRSRSALKLKEIDKQYHIFKKGQIVIDCGAAPGGWSQVAVECVSLSMGKVLSIDLLDIEPLEGVQFIKGDFTTATIQSTIKTLLGDRLVHVVLSDMAPNFTGCSLTDHLRTINLCTSVLDFSKSVLCEGGTFLSKIFQGRDDKIFIDQLRTMFRQVQFIKPEASRKESAEIYVLARGYTNKVKA